MYGGNPALKDDRPFDFAHRQVTASLPDASSLQKEPPCPAPTSLCGHTTRLDADSQYKGQAPPALRAAARGFPTPQPPSHRNGRRPRACAIAWREDAAASAPAFCARGVSRPTPAGRLQLVRGLHAKYCREGLASLSAGMARQQISAPSSNLSLSPTAASSGPQIIGHLRYTRLILAGAVATKAVAPAHVTQVVRIDVLLCIHARVTRHDTSVHVE